MSADGEIRLTPVEIGLQSEDMTEIVSGLNEGDTVVLEEATS
jgi:multidrug efflux pump subunit AcrA (membrane-fusion protein)